MGCFPCTVAFFPRARTYGKVYILLTFTNEITIGMHKRITYNLMYDLLCICYVIFYLNRIYKDLNSSVFRRSFPSNMFPVQD